MHKISIPITWFDGSASCKIDKKVLIKRLLSSLSILTRCRRSRRNCHQVPTSIHGNVDIRLNSSLPTISMLSCRTVNCLNPLTMLYLQLIGGFPVQIVFNLPKLGRGDTIHIFSYLPSTNRNRKNK